MTIIRHNGKTTFQIFTVGYIEQVVTDDLDELCKMVDARDEIIGNANAEMLKRGCHIVKLEQKCDSMDGVIKTVSECGDLYKVWWRDERDKAASLAEELVVSKQLNKISTREVTRLKSAGGVAVERYDENKALREKLSERGTANTAIRADNVQLREENERLEEELKCIKLAKDKTDAENTRLWALDKNEMHRKYEELHEHHTETENAYRQISRENYDLGRQVTFLKQKCMETDANISFTLRDGE